MSENTQRSGWLHSLHSFFRRQHSADDAPARTQRSWWSRLLPSFLRRRRPADQHSETRPHLKRTPSSPHDDASKTGQFKEAVMAGLAGLKITLDVADKFSDIIPIPGVSAVIGGLQALLERQEVWRTICLFFLALTGHSID